MSSPKKQGIPKKNEAEQKKVKRTATAKESDIFNFERLFKDAASFTKPKAQGNDIQYPRGSSLSKASPIVKDLFANSHYRL
ncbi:hypothetical protein ELQ35_13340 [Peribacillus cavernae]|uniref:Uncharacterized protein n=1 Tax=Peribacillus cavernae TaxID=1674310 RepID=A0A3S0TZV3_9BACI|nr:hypothetical protein [Peribacillus cavernae]MDQ0217755.1 hypothetical protein [Peribacillus cavernae]RUQ28214.1 hypothetical protein ELQ35_13340 [Peribacillus cavernae]